MTRPDPSGASEARPSWAGAAGFHPEDAAVPAPQAPGPDAAPEQGAPDGTRPGYQRVPEGMAHAPMPGAPPYPETPRPEVSPGTAALRQPDATPFPRALAAAGVWLAVNVLLTLVFYGRIGTVAGIATLVGFTLAVGLTTWFIARARTLVFWQVVLIAAPIYWVLRIVLFPRVM